MKNEIFEGYFLIFQNIIMTRPIHTCVCVIYNIMNSLTIYAYVYSIYTVHTAEWTCRNVKRIMKRKKPTKYVSRKNMQLLCCMVCVRYWCIPTADQSKISDLRVHKNNATSIIPVKTKNLTKSLHRRKEAGAESQKKKTK